jgi:cystathionine beta-lyase/cystathionine gamma-synthase
MTHRALSDDEKKVLGVTDSLIRLSIGIEDAEDLIADLENALSKAVNSSPISLETL